MRVVAITAAVYGPDDSLKLTHAQLYQGLKLRTRYAQ